MGKYEPFNYQPYKMVRHTQTICQVLPTNCLILPDHFVGLALKRLKIPGKSLYIVLENFIYS